MLLSDEKWSKENDRWIAVKCGVHHDMVASRRKQLAESSTWVAQPPVSSEGAAKPNTRKGQDGKQYPSSKRKPKAKPPANRTEFASAANDFAASIEPLTRRQPRAYLGDSSRAASAWLFHRSMMPIVVFNRRLRSCFESDSSKIQSETLKLAQSPAIASRSDRSGQTGNSCHWIGCSSIGLASLASSVTRTPPEL